MLNLIRLNYILRWEQYRRLVPHFQTILFEPLSPWLTVHRDRGNVSVDHLAIDRSLAHVVPTVSRSSLTVGEGRRGLTGSLNWRVVLRIGAGVNWSAVVQISIPRIGLEIIRNLVAAASLVYDQVFGKLKAGGQSWSSSSYDIKWHSDCWKNLPTQRLDYHSFSTELPHLIWSNSSKRVRCRQTAQHPLDAP